MTKILILLLIFSPLIMALLLMSPLFSDEENLLRKASKRFSIFHIVITIIALIFFDFDNIDFKYETIFNWIPSIGINASFSIDAFSMLLCTLTSIIFAIAIFSSKSMIKKSYRLYYSLVFFLQSAILGVFCAQDIFLFFLFWELELIPMYLLLLKWGSGNNQKTAMKFLLYTFFGSLFLLLGFLILYFYNSVANGVLSANYSDLDTYLFPEKLKLCLFTLFLIGFGVKLPIFPLHSWLPDAHTQAPTPVSILLSAILLKMGAYGLIKFNLMLFDDTFAKIAPLIMLFGLISIIYASLCAVAQKDIKRIIAFSGVAHMGILLMGLSSLNRIGLTGAMFQIFSHALITTGLFVIAGIIYKKCGTKNILRLKGLGSKMPKLMFISVPIVLAAIGIPLLCGFVAEFLCFTGAFTLESHCILNTKIMTIIALTSIIICSVYILKFFHGIFFGELLPKYKKVTDINVNQSAILSIIAVYIAVLGVFPSILTNILSFYSISIAGVF